MCRYLFTILAIACFLQGNTYGQHLDSLSDDETSLEGSHAFTGIPSVALADDSEDPDSGNWYEKLRWWKEAKALYTVDIRSAMDELEVIYEELESKKNDILSALDSYSASLPLKRQAAIHVIDDLLNDLTKRQEALAQERTRTQTRKNPEETTELEDHQKMLNELKKEFEDFNTLYQRLKQVFEVVIPAQMQTAHNYSEEALAAYEGIEETLDDKKAHGLFNQVQNGLENIQAISMYLRESLWNFIDKAWNSSEQLMPKITKSITDLEEKGVVVRPLSAQEKAQMAKLEEERKAKRAQKEAELKAQKEWEALPWWQKAYMSVGYFFSKIGSVLWQGISKPFTWLAGLFTAQEAEKPETGKAAKTKNGVATAETAVPQPPLPTKLPVVVSGALAPQNGAQKNAGTEKVQFPESKAPIQPVGRSISRNEQRLEKPANSSESHKSRDAEELEGEEPTIEDEDIEGEESDDESEEADEEEGSELESEEEESPEAEPENAKPDQKNQNNNSKG